MTKRTRTRRAPPPIGPRPGGPARRRLAAVLPLRAALWLPAALLLSTAPLSAQDTVRLYEEACADDQATACDVLGQMYLAGDGVPQDLGRALELFRAACDRGEPGGCNHLALMYHAGAGVERDVAEAIALYRLGCRGGDEAACGNLAALGLERTEASDSGGGSRSGRVLAAGTRDPLDGAIVELPELGVRMVTGASGRVELARLPTGSHRITAERAGYERLEGRIPVPYDGEFLLLMTPIDTGDRTGPGTVVGRVTEEESGRGLSEVAIRVSGAARSGALTDAGGRFTLTVDPGLVELELSRIGYEPRSTRLVVQPGRTVEVSASMATQAIELAPIEVTVRSSYLERNGFYRRAGRAGGRQFTRDDLDEINPMFVSDIFWRVPGAYVRHGVGGTRVVSRRGASFTRGPCTMRIFLDGIPTAASDLDTVPPDWLEAVEVYQGTSTPLQYGAGMNACGAVLLWTRRGR